MAQVLSFEQSGLGAAAVGTITLEQVNNLALSCGFVKAGVDPSKPAAQRVDIAAFWKATGVNSLSAFRTVFADSRMAPPKPGTVAPRIIPNANKKADTVRRSWGCRAAVGLDDCETRCRHPCTHSVLMLSCSVLRATGGCRRPRGSSPYGQHCGA